ncbi:hypothetical protein BJY16_006691 [Actinoplanes octamycinicus]|uniref:Barstar (Barnase inhibitor) n=1 Tax=Actinoplanes octamycinicus TaxID=135948 RepID=A0A7W7H3J8_9ACTN|nr:hypothetical protein [Actinoplanes octamycinicus]MBB4743232.1 hypothetical protein [Actinoplanes octamycinicus]GIE61204.1 hypothetical protein Aoc01nite_66060 [Actinoplanes octamycinicus]
MLIPPRWRLLDETSGGILTECADVDGLFADRVFPAEPARERYTLVGCAPAGALRAAIDGDGPAWLGNVVVDTAHVPGRPVSEPCVPHCRDCVHTMEELLDVRVVGHRAAGDGSGLLNVDLEGHRRDDDNNQNGTVAPAVAGYRLLIGEQRAGECREIAGLFRERPEIWPPGPPITLLGCTAELTGPVEAELAHVRVDGTVHRLSGWGPEISGSVVASRPSVLGDGLVDISLDARIAEPLAANERVIWDLWRAGGPAEPNQWAALDRGGRALWVQAAAVHRIRTADRPAGTVYHPDGRYVTDYDGFCCAIGEAVNGPGGWFGGDSFWLHENAATGDGGATPGFELIWHDAGVAREHLVPGYDRMSWGPAATFDDLVAFLTGEGVRVELR